MVTGHLLVVAKRPVRAPVLLPVILVWRLYRTGEPEENEAPDLADDYRPYGASI
jgi:hypothetical protein